MGRVFPNGWREPAVTLQVGAFHCHGGLTPTAPQIVWLIRDGDPLPDWVAPHTVLSAAEIARADSIRHPVAKSNFMRGRAVLRSALAQILACDPSDVPIRIAFLGKPFVDMPDVHFNMSHTAGFALFGIGRVPIGVDIESADPKRDCDGLMRRYFTPEEQGEYFGLPAERRPAAFLRGWTCKEALLKAIGSGVRDLQNCRVRMNPDAEPAVLLAPGDATWQLAGGEVEPGVSWAVCTRFEFRLSPS